MAPFVKESTEGGLDREVGEIAGKLTKKWEMDENKEKGENTLKNRKKRGFNVELSGWKSF